jgi:hypothetical protein
MENWIFFIIMIIWVIITGALAAYTYSAGTKIGRAENMTIPPEMQF